MRTLPTCVLLSCITTFVICSDVFALQKGNPNNAGQERKDDAKVQSERQDINEAEKKIQADLKELRAAELEAKKSAEAFTKASKAKNETIDNLERKLGEKLGLPKANEAQRAAQLAYDEASKKWLEAMKTNPKYMEAIEKAGRASATLKSLASTPNPDESIQKQQQTQAASDMAEWRSTLSSYLASISELNPVRDKLATAQKKLADLRTQLKQQVESHPELKASEKNRLQAKEETEKDEQKVATLRRKAASDQSKLLAEKSQLAKAIAQDKQNDNKNNNKNDNKNNNQKKNGNKS
jgi:hypothetical protein